MLTLPRIVKSNNSLLHCNLGKKGESQSTTHLVGFEHMFITASDLSSSCGVALHCHTPLDAIELDRHGYSYGFYEQGGGCSHATLAVLKTLGISKVVCFCDVHGSGINVSALHRFAPLLNMQVCEVMLPFSPCDFALWDSAQWRIFDKRLHSALGVSSHPKPLPKPIKHRGHYEYLAI
tara:strand:- start:7945 stop:8478 length:534 start_codon:yes stop_codon:yes gene_type:complete